MILTVNIGNTHITAAAYSNGALDFSGKLSAAPSTGDEYAIAVSQDNPDLVDPMNEAIAALTEDGTLDEIIANNMG